jgi:hypothetical protein
MKTKFLIMTMLFGIVFNNANANVSNVSDYLTNKSLQRMEQEQKKQSAIMEEILKELKITRQQRDKEQQEFDQSQVKGFDTGKK